MEGAVGLRVLEVGRGVGTAAAGLAFVALGAEVAQVRLPGRRVPDRERTYYDRGRVRVAGGDDLGPLAAAADVIVADLDDDALRRAGLPLDVGDLRAAPPQVLVTIRSLGRWGPNSGFRMTDLTEWASGGIGYGTRRPHHADPERYVPVVPPGFQPQGLAGINAVTGALAALRWAAARGEGVVVDVSVQEVVAATLHSIVPPFVFNGTVLGHPSTPTANAGMLVPASDGDVYIRTVETHQWERLMAWLGDPDWAILGNALEARIANREALATLVGEWTSCRPRLELVVEGQRRRVPIALPRSLQDVLTWQHLRARGAWTSVDHEGEAVEAPRWPAMEPPSWPAARDADAREVVDAWTAVHG
jgi:crotonobetainyl-CoA:carnitine CoA-transferase CaiB-like acyl-CoA transferase